MSVSLNDLKGKIKLKSGATVLASESVAIPLTAEQADKINSAMKSAEFALKALDPFSGFLGEQGQDAFEIGVCMVSGYNEKISEALTKAANDGSLSIVELAEIGMSLIAIFKECGTEI